MADDLGFDLVAYAREVMADKNHKDRDDLSCLAMEIMGALVSSIDRLQGRLDSLHRSKVEYATAERGSLRLALAEAHARIADLENPNFVNCDGLHADGKYPNTPHRPIGINRLYPCPACAAERASETDGAVGEAAEPFDIECPKCHASAGSRCMVLVDHEYFYREGHHPERLAALSSPPRPAPPTSDFHTSCDWCKRDIPNACYAVLCSDCDRRGNTALFAPPADAATEGVRMLRHLCNVYGCTSYGRKPDHGPDDCSWCEAEALLSTPAPAPSAKEGRT